MRPLTYSSHSGMQVKSEYGQTGTIVGKNHTGFLIRFKDRYTYTRLLPFEYLDNWFII